MVIFKEFPDGFGLHLSPSVIDDLGTLILGHIKNIFKQQSLLNKMTGFLGTLAPADQPVNDLAGMLIEKQVQIQKQSPLK
jgi:hypothetical protein